MAIRTIELLLHGNAGQAIGEMEKLATVTSTSADTMHQKVSNMAAKITMATAAAGIGIAAVSVKLADDFEKAHALLQKAVENTGGSMKQINPIIEEQKKKFQTLGFNYTDYEQALARGVTGTGNAQKALALMGHAADFAAVAHVSLEAAMTSLVKLSEGKLRPAAQVGIDLSNLQASSAKQLAQAQDKVTKAGEALQLVQEKINDGRLKGANATDAAHKAYKNLSDAMGELQQKSDGAQNALDAVNKRTAGASQAQAETFAGKIKGLQTTLENMGIKIGLAIIPVLEKMAGALESVIGWFEKNEGAAKALGIAVGVVLAGALAIFTYDKAVAFIAGLQRMGTAMGLMGTQAATAGTEVEAGGASMAGILLPIALIAGGAYGLSLAFNDVGLAIDVNAQKLQALNAQGLQPWVNKLIDAGNKLQDTNVVQKAFNQILEKSPQSAQLFIDAVQRAGGSVFGLQQQLADHNITAEQAKVATQRMGIEMQIADAKARGDAASVYGLTLQLAALPTNPTIRLNMIGVGEALGQVQGLNNTLNAIDGRVVHTAVVNTIHEIGGGL